MAVVLLGLCSQFEGITWIECLGDRPSGKFHLNAQGTSLKLSIWVIEVTGGRRGKGEKLVNTTDAEKT